MRRPLALLTVASVLVAAPNALAEVPAEASDRDCSDFASQRAAQLYFLRIGGPGRNPDRLDADNDGIACDANRCPCYNGRSLPDSDGGGDRSRQRDTRPRNRRQTIKSRIIDVLDGDTVRVRTLEPTRKPVYTVRLIGIDTPQTRPLECGALEATDAAFYWSFDNPRDTDGDDLFDTRGGRGRRVVLVADPSQGLFDRYRRLLAYVTIRERQTLNGFQITRGWSRVYVFRKPFARLAAFRKTERRARRAERGAWNLCGGTVPPPRTALRRHRRAGAAGASSST